MLFVTGAPGAGKSAVAAPLARLIPDFAVLDMDVLLEPAGALARVDLRADGAANLWPAYNDLWIRLAAELAKVRPVLLLGPLIPREVDHTASRRRLLRIDWVLLDCSNGTRRERLGERGYGPAAIERAIVDAEETRGLGLDAIATDGRTPEQTASDVADWAAHVSDRLV